MDERDIAAVLRDIEARLERIEKRQRAMRRAGILKLCVILAIVAVLAVILTPRISAFIEQYRAVVGQVDRLTDALDGLNLEALKTALNSFAEVDFSGIKDAIASLTAKLEPLLARFG